MGGLYFLLYVRRFFQYFAGAAAGAVVCFGIGFAFAQRDPFAIMFFSVLLGIPLGAGLGLLSVYRAIKANQPTTGDAVRIAVQYFAGGLAGGWAGGAIGVLITLGLKVSAGWIPLVLGLLIGGIAGVKVVGKFLKKKAKRST